MKRAFETITFVAFVLFVLWLVLLCSGCRSAYRGLIPDKNAEIENFKANLTTPWGHTEISADKIKTKVVPDQCHNPELHGKNVPFRKE